MAFKIEMMRCFRAVARQGTLASAAETLARTPSAISMMLTQFEAHIGAPLFESDRKNRLTPLGMRVLEECDRALNAFDRSADAIERHARSTAGIVRVVAVPSATITLLPDAIAQFRRNRPDVRLEISDGDSAAVRRRLHFDEADIGVASAPADADDPDEPGLVRESLLRDRLGIVCRTDSPILARRDDGWDALGQESIIYNPICDLVAHSGLNHLSAASTLAAQNTMTLLSFVAAGLGATILPARAMNNAPSGLSFFAPDRPSAYRNLVLITTTRRQLSPAVRAFRSALTAVAERETND